MTVYEVYFFLENVRHVFCNFLKLKASYGVLLLLLQLLNLLKRMEKADSSLRASRHQPNPLPVLVILAKDVGELAIKEKDVFSLILKRWHPFSAGVAVGLTEIFNKSTQGICKGEQWECCEYDN